MKPRLSGASFSRERGFSVENEASPRWGLIFYGNTGFCVFPQVFLYCLCLEGCYLRFISVLFSIHFLHRCWVGFWFDLGVILEAFLESFFGDFPSSRKMLHPPKVL